MSKHRRDRRAETWAAWFGFLDRHPYLYPLIPKGLK